MSVLPSTDPVPVLRPARYAVSVIVLHWLVFLLMAGAYATMELRELFPKGSPERVAMRLWHYGLGLAVLASVLVRVLARASTRSPGIVPAPPAWQERVAKLAHVALYALMIALPMLGWLALSAEGRPITLAGVPLPMPIGPDKEWVKPLEKIHEILGQAGYALVGLHAAAALWHHHVMHDNTLALMWPFAKSR
jgi:superoxide oxidase